MNTRVQVMPKSAYMLEWALFYASIGLPIIPIYESTINGQCACKNEKCSSIGKHPRVKNGLKDASKEHDVITKWWAQWPHANIGLITGTLSGVFVLDVDPKNGGTDSLSLLESEYGPIEALKVRTGGNGLHFYFTMPDNRSIRNKVNLLPGLDIRADGGYIIAPPSCHRSGSLYEWQSESWSGSIAPDWLIGLCTASVKKSSSSCQRLIPSQDRIVAPIGERSLFIFEGSRNSFLCSLAGSMHKYGLDRAAVLSLLQEINQVACFPNLNYTEIERIANSIAHYPKESESTELWETPVSMQEMTSQPPSMDLNLVPKALQPWALDIATRMQIPLEMICIPALVAIGSVIGKKIRIYPKQRDNWVVNPNVWGAVVARPGTLKSPAISEALKPLEALVQKEHQLFMDNSKKWEIQKSIKTATVDAIQDQLARCLNQGKKQESDALQEQLSQIQEEIIKSTPLCKRFKTNDATVEKLVELLTANPNGLLLVRDELSGWLATLNKAGREGEREFWLESWGGKGSYTVDRIGRGTVHASSLCLSVFGAIQPDKLENLITAPLQSNDDGLLQRFQLIVCPEIKEKWENHDIEPNRAAQKDVEELFEKIAAYVPDNTEGFIGVRFSFQAQDLFNTWREKLENALRQKEFDYPPFEAHLSKYRSLIPSLALIFEIITTGLKPVEVSLESVNLALEWEAYLIQHAKKIYQMEEYQSERISIQAFIKKIYEKKIYDGMTVRTLLRNSWEHLKNKDQVENILDFLAQKHWIKIVESKKTGGLSRSIALNPSLITKTQNP